MTVSSSHHRRICVCPQTHDFVCSTGADRYCLISNSVTPSAQPPTPAGAVARASQSVENPDTDPTGSLDLNFNRNTVDPWSTGVCRTERSIRDHQKNQNACRDSQVWSTAQRSGRCPVGVRRFKSCSLHSSTVVSQYGVDKNE